MKENNLVRRLPLDATTLTALIILVVAGGSLWVADRALPARAESPALSGQSLVTLTVSPQPVSPTGSLAAGTNVTITITARDASQTAIDGAQVYLRLLPTAGGGSAKVGAAALTSTPQAFTSDSAGNVVVAYATPTLLPGAGMDVLVAQNTASDPTVSASTSYSFAPLWETTGSMAAPRVDHTATLLPNGKVLIAGGISRATAELYDPATGTFSATGSMATPRGLHTATLLPNGKVLITGGGTYESVSIATAELYDPATGTFSPTGGNGMSVPRTDHTATLLNNGKVLIAGGHNLSTNLRTAELYDPNTATFGPAITMAAPHTHHTATALEDGKVLLAGPGTEAELYDPVTGSFSATGSLRASRWFQAAGLLPDGKVLLAGGGGGAEKTALASAELYDPDTGTFSSNGSMGISSMNAPSAVLPDGSILVLGGKGGWGSSNSQALRRTELYVPAIGAFFPHANMATARSHFSATLLRNGNVLVAGGYDGSWGQTSSAEIYSFRPSVISPSVVILPYGADGYRYKQVSAGDEGGGFQDLAFDDSSWAMGSAGFGNEGSSACGLPIGTNWGEGTAMLIRKQVNLPPGSANVKIGVAIDNDARIWFNGNEIGYGTHENCATRDSFVLSVPQGALVSGTNLIAVRGLDRFAWTYLDIEVTADVPPATPIARLELTPYPLAATGALTAGATSPVTVTARDANGRPISGALVQLSFQRATGGGSARVWSTTLTDKPQVFAADAHGQITVSYTTPVTLPNDGKDVLKAESPMGSPVVSASAPYAFFSSCGDLTGDGAANVLDVITVLKVAVQSAEPSAAQNILGDLDRNGVTNALDAVRILQAIVGVGAIDGCGAPASG